LSGKCIGLVANSLISRLFVIFQDLQAAIDDLNRLASECVSNTPDDKLLLDKIKSSLSGLTSKLPKVRKSDGKSKKEKKKAAKHANIRDAEASQPQSPEGVILDASPGLHRPVDISGGEVSMDRSLCVFYLSCFIHFIYIF